MIPITRQDEELIKTFYFALRVANAQKNIDHFRNKYENNPEDAAAAYQYGLCMYIYEQVDKNATNTPKWWIISSKAFSDCLKIQNGHWIARYVRSEINQRIPEGLMEMSSSIKSDNYDIVEADKDRQILIDLQDGCPEKQPYFICPYITQAKAFLYKGDIDNALETYKKGMSKVPVEKVPFDIAYLYQPVSDLIVSLRKVNLGNDAEELKSFGLELFPSATVIRMS